MVFPECAVLNGVPEALNFGGRIADAEWVCMETSWRLGGLSGPFRHWGTVRRVGRGRTAAAFSRLTLDRMMVALLRRRAPASSPESARVALLRCPGRYGRGWGANYRVLNDRHFKGMLVGMLFLSGIGLAGAKWGCTKPTPVIRGQSLEPAKLTSSSRAHHATGTATTSTAIQPPETQVENGQRGETFARRRSPIHCAARLSQTEQQQRTQVTNS